MSCGEIACEIVEELCVCDAEGTSWRPRIQIRLLHRVDEYGLAGKSPKVQTTSATMAVFRRFLSRWSAFWAHAAVDNRPRPRWRPPVDPADTAEVPPRMSRAIPRSMP